MKTKFKYQKGVAVLLYVTVITIIALLFLSIAQSQFLLATKRNVAFGDRLITEYGAESEVNDFIAKIHEGYISDAQLAAGISKNITLGGTTIILEAKNTTSGSVTTQTVTVKAKRAFAVSEIRGSREVTTSGNSVDGLEITLMMDCTQSMQDLWADDDNHALGNRFHQARLATTNFVQKLMANPNADKVHLGLGIFKSYAKWVDPAWLGYAGGLVKPDSGVQLQEVYDILQNGLTDNMADGICKNVNGWTNIGGGFGLANNYYEQDTLNNKKITILITDGDPNVSHTDTDCPSPHVLNCDDYYGYDPGCSLKPYPYYNISCHLADKNTYVSEISQNGARPPDVDAYAITIANPVNPQAVDIFNKYGTAYYKLDNAGELTQKLEDLLNSVLITTTTNFSLKKIVPGK